MKRLAWMALAAAMLVGAGCRQKELEELKMRNAKLEAERAELMAQVAALSRKVEAMPKDTAASPAPAAADTATAEEQLQRAQDAYVHGQYRLAIDLATKTVGSNPSRAWRVIGASECFLKNQASAAQASAHLDDQGKAFLKYVCSRSGVKL